MGRKLAVVLGLAAIWVVALAGVAQAKVIKPAVPGPPPPCTTPGSEVEVTTSVQLTADYGCSLHIDALDPSTPILIDLGGHTLDGFILDDTNAPVYVRWGTVTGRVGPLEHAPDTGTSLTIDGVHVKGSAGAELGGDLTIRFSVIDGPVLVGGLHTSIHFSAIHGGILMSDTNNDLALNITHNRLNSSPGAGVTLLDNFGQPDVSGIVAWNVISHSGGPGMDLGDGSDLSGLVVSGNRLNHNGGDGIRLGPSSFPGGGSATFTGNIAIGNAGHGFNLRPTAPDTAVDGGFNVAFANQTQPQCVGLAC
jgi:hypothetical protein